MVHDVNQDPLKELEAALSVKPSPEFAARVRERVRQESLTAKKTSWGWWSLAAAGVVIAMVGVASVTTWTRDARSSTTVVADATRNGGPGLQTRPAETKAPAVIAKAGVDRALHQSPVRTAARSNMPEVLISGDEARAIEHLIASLAAGRVSSDDVLAPFETPKIQPVVVTLDNVTVTFESDASAVNRGMGKR